MASFTITLPSPKALVLWIGAAAVLSAAAWHWLPALVTKPVASTTSQSRMQVAISQAKAGDSDAMVEMGLRYRYGIGVAKDMEAASGWLSMAAKAGNPYGAFYRAHMKLESGDELAAVKDFAAIAKQPAHPFYAAACYQLGLVALNKQEAPAAEGWFLMAANRRYAPAMSALVELYTTAGRMAEAKQWDDLATSRGEESGGMSGLK